MTTSWGGVTSPLAASELGDLARLAEFRNTHPEWVIGRGPGFWQACRREPGGETIVTRYQLGELLDKLADVLRLEALPAPRGP